MSPSETRLAELSAIRDRSLTEEEQAEAIRCAVYVRANAARRRKYMNDQAYRAKVIERNRDYLRRKGA